MSKCSSQQRYPEQQGNAQESRGRDDTIACYEWQGLYLRRHTSALQRDACICVWDQQYDEASAKYEYWCERCKNHSPNAAAVHGHLLFLFSTRWLTGKGGTQYCKAARRCQLPSVNRPLANLDLTAGHVWSDSRVPCCWVRLTMTRIAESSVAATARSLSR